ncbi:solute carrier family 28 member 3-like [Symsagittifera roscoffensis]|uniref:solute carrier family 28 member 3-like n=1 Tax=Symsagittifera roscoffensis TaxID=84072 RepID=UPI00307BB1AB
MSSRNSSSPVDSVNLPMDERNDENRSFMKDLKKENGAIATELRCSGDTYNGDVMVDDIRKDSSASKSTYKVHNRRRHCILTVRKNIAKFFESPIFKRISAAVLLILLGVYLTLAFRRSVKEPLVLTIMAAIFIAYKVFEQVKDTKTLQSLKSIFLEFARDVNLRRKWNFIKCVLLGLSWLMVCCFVAHSCYCCPRNSVSFIGLVFLLLFSWLISRNPLKISLRIILCGLNLQFLMGLLITRTSFGASIFETLSEGVDLILKFSEAGSQFIFGALETGNIGNGTSIGVVPNQAYFVFAIHALPVIVVYCALANVLYHFGIMQAVIRVISLFMIETMGTSAPETLNAAANIFLGQTEAPFLIKPLIPTLTSSELHAVMTGGFATVAGAVLAVYSGMGIDSSNLIAASVMNAPAALVFSKIVYPESKSKEEIAECEQRMETVKFRNVFVAAAKGASDSVMFVLNVTMNLIAFVSLCEMVNYIVAWSGDLIGIEELSFAKLSSYVFYPLAFMIGVDYQDCFKVAELIGIKTTVNEMVAYQKLSTYEGQISERSTTLATFALCGFANFASLGIQIGGIGALAPSRVEELSVLGLSALLCGSFACFSNACIMGLLYQSS